MVEINFTGLPSLPLANKADLPECSAIYFAIDSIGRVFYVGKATNLCNRWRDHHRFEQLSKLSRKTPVRLSWLQCDLQKLDELEKQYIESCYPLLNQTLVPAKKITPAEISLQKTLTKLFPHVVVFGLSRCRETGLPLVCMKYNGVHKSPVRSLRNIFKTNNKTATNLKWVEFIKREQGFFRTACNGVRFELGPWWEPHLSLRDEGLSQTIAGVSMICLTEANLQQQIVKSPHLLENYPELRVLEEGIDPVPLLWSVN